MIYEKKLANAVGSKTARACDSCLRRRARWYCAADDAFLCQGCDASVHSANPLARRHERIRLKSATLKPSDDASVEGSLPAWHQGFTRKARTPRHGKPTVLQSPKIEEPMLNPFPLVPDMGSDEPSLEENEEQLLYRVPIFDPFMEEFCTSTSTPNEAAATANDATTEVVAGSVDNLTGFLPSDIDLAEFAADVESLLGRGLDEDSFGMEGLGLLVSKEEDAQEFCFGSGRAKVEEEEREDVKDVVACQVDPELDMAREPLDLKFEYDSPTTAEEGEKDKVVAGSAMVTMNSGYKTEEMTRRILLKLDYEAVIIAWASQGSPWITGDRPQLNSDDCWLDLPVTIPAGVQHQYGDLGGHMGVGDGGREARVSRYREKRRTRLFSKKIRYEVRRLNAEKRPRMKGRFVKRESFAGTGFPF